MKKKITLKEFAEKAKSMKKKRQVSEAFMKFTGVAPWEVTATVPSPCHRGEDGSIQPDKTGWKSDSYGKDFFMRALEVEAQLYHRLM